MGIQFLWRFCGVSTLERKRLRSDFLAVKSGSSDNLKIGSLGIENNLPHSIMSMDIDEPGTPPPGLAPWSAPFGPAVGTGGLPLTGENSSKKKKTTRCIIDNPTLDLDVYIANYSGKA